MRIVWIFAGVGLCVLLGAVLYFAPKLQNKADIFEFEKSVQEFGKIYLKFQNDNGRPPKSMEELQTLVDRAAPATRQRVKNDEFVVAWGVRMGPENPDSESRVLILAKPIIHDEQFVIYQDGKMRHYSPKEVAKLTMATVPASSESTK